MLDQDKLLAAIHKRIQELDQQKQDNYYLDQIAIDKTIEELYRLKFSIEQGDYNVQIWD